MAVGNLDQQIKNKEEQLKKLQEEIHRKDYYYVSDDESDDESDVVEENKHELLSIKNTIYELNKDEDFKMWYYNTYGTVFDIQDNEHLFDIKDIEYDYEQYNLNIQEDEEAQYEESV